MFTNYNLYKIYTSTYNLFFHPFGILSQSIQPTSNLWDKSDLEKTTKKSKTIKKNTKSFNNHSLGTYKADNQLTPKKIIKNKNEKKNH